MRKIILNLQVWIVFLCLSHSMKVKFHVTLLKFVVNATCTSVNFLRNDFGLCWNSVSKYSFTVFLQQWPGLVNRGVGYLISLLPCRIHSQLYIHIETIPSQRFCNLSRLSRSMSGMLITLCLSFRSSLYFSFSTCTYMYRWPQVCMHTHESKNLYLWL